MLYYTLIFLLLAVIAGALGFWMVASTAGGLRSGSRSAMNDAALSLTQWEDDGSGWLRQVLTSKAVSDAAI